MEEDVVHHHTLYYGEHWDFDERFPAQVNQELGVFIEEFNRERDCFWWAARGGDFAGAIAVDGSRYGAGQARIRWFIVPEAFQGTGVGGVLLDQTVQFCRSKGFKLVESQDSTGWGPSIVEQKFELIP